MQRKIIVGAAIALALAVIAPGALAQQGEKAQKSQMGQKSDVAQQREKGQRALQVQQRKRFDVATHTKAWGQTAKEAARAMTEKYGTPDGITPMMLIWDDTGPFKRTIVYREEVDHQFPMPHKDVLEQFIDYEVPAEKFDELAQYDGSVMVERTKGEMSARCDKEMANILALNLADDVVTGRKTVQQARDVYARSILDAQKGEPPAIASRLMFDLKQGGTDDPDSVHRFVAQARESQR